MVRVISTASLGGLLSNNELGDGIPYEDLPQHAPSSSMAQSHPPEQQRKEVRLNQESREVTRKPISIGPNVKKQK